MKWWEKSVEYYFVKKFLPLETMISAFDGKHEQIGDVLLQHADRWIMIEFKVDKDAINSEKNKFHDYESALKSCLPMIVIIFSFTVLFTQKMKGSACVAIHTSLDSLLGILIRYWRQG